MSLSNRDETPVKVSFTLPRHILEDLDEFAEAAKKTRSELLRSLLRTELNAVDLDDVRRYARYYPPNKYECVFGAAKRSAKENKDKEKNR